MRRRAFAGSALIFASLPEIAAAQMSARVFRIGWIVGTSAAASAPLLDALRKGLADLGYIEGRKEASAACDSTSAFRRRRGWPTHVG
jgi:hypothetical protein